MEVTWDSSRTNSYFYHPLTNILAKADDFSVSFDLTLRDYVVGITPGQPYAFAVAIGFLNIDEAMLPNFSRGSGVNSRYGPKNLVEFDFFPAFDVFAPTIAQAIVSTNNVWLYNHENLLDMPPGELFHIEMSFVAATRTLTTVTLRNGVQYGEPQTIQVPTNTFDFRATAISVSSYSDQHADGSVLAHGVVDNFLVTVPDPPIGLVHGRFATGGWRVEFLSRTNWFYQLERSADLSLWQAVGVSAPGNGGLLSLPDAASSQQHFYRVRADRP